jgi:hypothetical protein
MKRNRGIVLIFVVGMLALMSVLALAFVALVRLERAIAQNYVDHTQAWMVAESGIEYAIARLRAMPAGVEQALRPFDAIYRQPGGQSPLAEVAERLGAAMPADRAEIDLPTYRGLRPPWNDWSYVVARGRAGAPAVARVALEARP